MFVNIKCGPGSVYCYICSHNESQWKKNRLTHKRSRKVWLKTDIGTHLFFHTWNIVLLKYISYSFLLLAII